MASISDHPDPVHIIATLIVPIQLFGILLKDDWLIDHIKALKPPGKAVAPSSSKPNEPTSKKKPIGIQKDVIRKSTELAKEISGLRNVFFYFINNDNNNIMPVINSVVDPDPQESAFF